MPYMNFRQFVFTLLHNTYFEDVVAILNKPPGATVFVSIIVINFISFDLHCCV